MLGGATWLQTWSLVARILGNFGCRLVLMVASWVRRRPPTGHRRLPGSIVGAMLAPVWIIVGRCVVPSACAFRCVFRRFTVMCFILFVCFGGQMRKTPNSEHRHALYAKSSSFQGPRQTANFYTLSTRASTARTWSALRCAPPSVMDGVW